MINGTTHEGPEKPDRRSRTRRILDWILPHPHMMFRTDRSLYVRLMPELREFDAPEHRMDAFRKAQHCALTRNVGYWLFVIGFGAAFVVCCVGPFWLDVLGRLYAPPYFIPLVGFFMFGSILLPPLVFRDRIRRNLRRQLFEQGRPICIPCGYNLTGNDSGRCPECGWQIERYDGLTAGPGH